MPVAAIYSVVDEIQIHRSAGCRLLAELPVRGVFLPLNNAGIPTRDCSGTENVAYTGEIWLIVDQGWSLFAARDCPLSS